jgi:hypothetical protein
MKRARLFSLTIALIVLSGIVGTGPAPPNETPPPRIGTYSNSGCLRDAGGDPYWPCGDDEIVLAVKGSTLHTLHHDATYNCCPDDIVVWLSIEGSTIYLTEEEILAFPCPCLCCYDVQATVVNLSPGIYTVEYCWYDYDTGQVECHVEDIVVP